MNKLLLALLLVPSFAFAEPFQFNLLEDSGKPIAAFKTEYVGFRADVEAPLGSNEIRVKKLGYKLPVSDKLKIVTNAAVEVDPSTGLSNFNMVKIGSIYYIKPNLSIGTFIATDYGVESQGQAKVRLTVRYTF